MKKILGLISKGVLLFLFMLTIGIQLKGQDALTPTLNYVPSPQTWDFMKYGSIPIKQYTGSLDMQIPLYHYKDKDFNIPISIAYNSAGFVPSKPSGPIGLNWFLNFGGVITREVVEVPDDMALTVPEIGIGIAGQGISNVSMPTNGIFHRVKKLRKGEVALVDMEKLWELKVGVEINMLSRWRLESTPNNTSSESTPDIYHFNMMGVQGKFQVDYNGDVHVYDCENAGELIVDYSGVETRESHQSNTIRKSTFSITTGNGYVYTFGGESESGSLEYFSPCKKTQYGQYERVGTKIIASWYLTQITAPNGRKVIYNYRKSNYTDLASHYVIADNSGQDIATLTPYQFYGNRAGSSSDPTLQTLRTVCIEDIVIDDCQIKFQHSFKEKVEIQETQSFAKPTLKVDKISVLHKSNKIRTIDFYYKYLGKIKFEKTFLDKLVVDNTETYRFSYIQPENLPNPLTYAIDFWGFWNGSDQSNLIPPASQTSEGDFTYNSSIRESSSTNGVFNIGLLNKVEYPTGGSSSITYEPHSYTQRLERRSDNLFYPQLYPFYNGVKTGGARVASIADNSNGETITRTFLYQKTLYSTEGSGILMDWPRLVYRFYVNNIYLDGNSSSGVSINCLDREHIVYSSVIEKRSDGSLIVNKFSNYNDAPDDNSHMIKEAKAPDFSSIYGGITPTSLWTNYSKKPNSYVNHRGKLLQKALLNKQSLPVLTEYYAYGRTKLKNIVSVERSGSHYYSYRTFTYSSYLQNVITTQDNVTTSRQFMHNDLNRKIKETTINHLGQEENTNYRFLEDVITENIGGKQSKIYQAMLKANMIGLPLEIVSTVKINNVNYVKGVKVFKYKLTEKEQVALDGLFELKISIPIKDYKVLKMDKDGFVMDLRLEREVLYQGYDDKLNPTQITDKSGIPSAYLWGYNKQYPVAKIIGATYTDVVSKITATELDNISKGSYNDADMRTVLGKISTAFAGNKAVQITTYTYTPLVGMTSETDTNGVTTYYEYDSFGRLINAKDSERKLVKAYEYNYKK